MAKSLGLMVDIWSEWIGWVSQGPVPSSHQTVRKDASKSKAIHVSKIIRLEF